MNQSLIKTRREAMDSAIASNEQEGINLHPDLRWILDRVVEDGISTEAARVYIKDVITKIQQEHSELFWQGEVKADKNDPYVYEGTNILINKFNIIDQGLLSQIEGFFVATSLYDLRMSEK